MKKLAFLFLSITLVGCSKEDNNSSCDQKVWGINVSAGTYTLIVGPKSNQAEGVPVTKEVAYYYYGRISAEERCYEGTNIDL